MPTSKLSALFLAAALTGVPLATAAADSTPAAERAIAPARAATLDPSADSDRYAEREAAAPANAEFRGGASTVIVIGSSTLAIALIVLLIVILV